MIISHRLLPFQTSQSLMEDHGQTLKSKQWLMKNLQRELNLESGTKNYQLSKRNLFNSLFRHKNLKEICRS